MEHIEGLVAAPLAPLHADGSLNLDIVPAYANFLARSGVIGAFVNGTTGEGVLLTSQERCAVTQRWVEVAPAGFRVIVHIGHNCLEDGRSLARHAEEVGADAVGATLPGFLRPQSVEDLVEWSAALAAAAPKLPFYYYHIPSLSGVNFAMADYLPLAARRIPNFAGVKFTDENLDDYGRSVAFDGGKYDVLFGRDELLVRGLEKKARGAVGSTYNFAAPLYLRLIAAFKAGDLKTAEELQQKSIDLIDMLRNAPGSFFSAQKAALRMLGIDCGAVRLPLRPLSKEGERAFQEQLKRVDFLGEYQRLPGQA
jgi:N-acetylneuraminate lyase